MKELRNKKLLILPLILKLVFQASCLLISDQVLMVFEDALIPSKRKARIDQGLVLWSAGKTRTQRHDHEQRGFLFKESRTVLTVFWNFGLLQMHDQIW